MPRYQVQVADRESGNEQVIELQAETPDEAVRDIGRRGFLVCAIEELAIVPYAHINDRNTVAAAAPAPPSLQLPTVPGENVLFNRDGLLVSDARFACAGKSIAIRNITSVQITEMDQGRRYTPIIVFTVALTFVCFSVALASGRDLSAAAFGFVGLLFATASITLIVGNVPLPSAYTLQVRASSAETESITFPDQASAEQVRRALLQGIAATR